MTELDRIRNRDNWGGGGGGGPSFLRVCEKRSLAMRKKDKMFALKYSATIAKLWVLDYQYALVLIPIKVFSSLDLYSLFFNGSETF